MIHVISPTLRFSVLVFVALLIACGGNDDNGGSDDETLDDETLRILVTNDDGVGAEGIDALVEALIADPDNTVVACAPDGNRSLSGDMMGPSSTCGELGVREEQTASGFEATAIDGCPADAVRYALDELYEADAPPHVVLSGINEGQNVGAIFANTVSGTIGAAKTAARAGLPAVASSQGSSRGYLALDSEYDYEAGVKATLAWLDERRDALLDGQLDAGVTNLNIPSCEEGEVRGTLEVPLAETLDGMLDGQDCNSSLSNLADDIEALANGYVTRSSVEF